MHRKLLLVTLSLALTAGCKAERFGIHNRSCSEKFTSWSGDLTTHLLNGDQREGVFDYDPPGELITRIDGEYDLDDGDFEWEVSYNDDHYRRETRVDGYGTAYVNGDLDLEYDVTTELISDAEVTTTVRVVRDGCSVTERQRFGGGITDIEGDYRNGRYEYDRIEADGGEAEGEEYPDGSWNEEGTSILGNGTQTYETEGDADGYSKTDWEFVGSGSSGEGYDENFMNGDRHSAYTQQADGTTLVWDYTVDFYGNGTGTLNYNGQQCAVTYVSFTCTVVCGGDTYSCS